MKKIVITDALTVTDGDIDLRFFEAFGQLEIYPLTSYDEVADRIAEADIVLCNKTPLDRSILAEAPRLSYIGLFATGYNNIDIGFAKENGITVCNAGEYSTNAVAQHTFALLLEHYCRTAAYDSFVAEEGWVRSKTFSPFVYPTMELAGKTMGLIGYGSIGHAVAGHCTCVRHARAGLYTYADGGRLCDLHRPRYAALSFRCCQRTLPAQ